MSPAPTLVGPEPLIQVMSYYPGGNAGPVDPEPGSDEEEEIDEAVDPRAGGSSRRASADTTSTFWGGNQNPGGGGDSGQSYGWQSGHSYYEGKWFWTPQAWVWGKTLGEGVRKCIQKGWIDPSSEFCAWWAEEEKKNGEKPKSEKQNSSTASEKLPESCGGQDLDDEVLHGSGSQSQQSARDKPFTGKEHVPTHDGQITMREYERRVRLFEANTAIDPSFRAGRLVEKTQWPGMGKL